MLSICIIVKNESENLMRCLQSLYNYNYDIVVVDTGSTDNTKEIALKFTDNVFDFVWCDDFSAARNFAISKAKNNFIMMIDSDEFVTSIQKKELEELILQNPKSVGRINRNNVFSRNQIGFSGKEKVNRIFSKEYFYYKGKIHEQIVALNDEKYETYVAPVHVDHSGYDGNMHERFKKAERNIGLLKKVLEEEGDDPYILYQLGKGYYFCQDYKNAVYYFGKALEFDLDPKLEYVSDMVEVYGYALINNQQHEDALSLESIYEEFSYSADFVFMMGIVYMQNQLFNKAVEEFLKAVKFNECKVSGVNSHSAYYNVGVIMECIGDKKKAIEYYNKCENYEPAKQGIYRCRDIS